MNKKSTFVKWRRYLPLYLMLIPGAVYIFINNYIPMAGLIMAFEKYDYKLGTGDRLIVMPIILCLTGDYTLFNCIIDIWLVPVCATV